MLAVVRGTASRWVAVQSRASVGVACSMRSFCTAKEETKEGKSEEGEKKTTKQEKPKATEVDARVKKLQDELADVKKKLQYSVADGLNARRVAAEDVEKAREYSVTSFAKDMLEVMDTLDKSGEEFAKIPKAEMEKHTFLQSISTGMKLCNNIAYKNLARHGITKMEVKTGSKFDPHYHDALFNAPETKEVPEGHVIAVVKTGYNIKNRVLRAAQVGVAEKHEIHEEKGDDRM